MSLKKNQKTKINMANTDTREPKHILVLGDAGVGKTEYIKKKLHKGRFDPRYIPTKSGLKSTSGYESWYDGPVVYYEWPGQDKYGIITFPEKLDKIVYLYDCTNNMSYKNIKDWQKKVSEHYGDSVPKSVIVGNKFEVTGDCKVVTRKMFTCKGYLKI